MTASDPRLPLLQDWLRQLPPQLGVEVESLRPASADASFRRYFRLDTHHGTRILMDAPPEREPLGAFLDVTQRLQNAGIHVPEILARDERQGFLLLSDLGTQTFYDSLQTQPAPAAAAMHGWYMSALSTLADMQRADANGLPAYDVPRFLQELELFPDWYVKQHCGYELSDSERNDLIRMSTLLANRAAAQPQVLVHRDFHSPNLMVPIGDDPKPGVLDYQDAVLGPITYDLVSLLMDARTTWDESQQLDWGIRYWELARRQGLPVANDIADFHADWEWVGLQRNLRILGVFVRLSLRDGKSAYLKHLPRVEDYVRQVASHYDVLRPLLRLFDRLAEHQARQTSTPDAP